VATNLILEGKGAPTALLTTAKYVLEIGRQDIPRRSSLFAWVKPKRPVPPQVIFEIGGRLAPDDGELETLDETAVADAARAIKVAGITAVAVVFLHSYANPSHEQRAGDILRSILPDAVVSLSRNRCLGRTGQFRERRDRDGGKHSCRGRRREQPVGGHHFQFF
jgi:N-methylhydantoinase A